MTKVSVTGSLITLPDLGLTPSAPSFGAGIYLNNDVIYQRLASGVIGTLTNSGGGAGSVISVSVLTSIPGLASTGSPITVNGTIILSGTLTPGGGGTGIGAYTAGDLLYATAAQTLAKLGIGTARAFVQSSGSLPVYGTIIASDLPNTAVTPASYTNTDLTVDAQGRITAASNGTAGMTSFTAAGDTGTPQTISNGNTLSILGGTGLSSVASATDTVTVNLDNTAVTPASYTNTNLTVDAQGRITAASNGSGATLLDFNGFRLTPTTAKPVETANVANATSIYLTPYLHNLMSVYNGSSAWTTLASAELTISLSGLTSNTNYDVFVYDNSGTLAVDTLVAWTNSTTRATALVRQDGRWVKTGATTRRYVGTIRISGTTGELDWTPSPSAAPADLTIWNMQNRVNIPFVLIETTDSYSYNTATYRQANASANNQINAVVGLAESEIAITLTAIGAPTGANAAAAIGEDSTTTKATGCVGMVIGAAVLTPATLRKIVPLGYHSYVWLEAGNGTATTWYGDAGVPTTLQSGMTGSIAC